MPIKITTLAILLCSIIILSTLHVKSQNQLTSYQPEYYSAFDKILVNPYNGNQFTVMNQGVSAYFDNAVIIYTKPNGDTLWVKDRYRFQNGYGYSGYDNLLIHEVFFNEDQTIDIYGTHNDCDIYGKSFFIRIYENNAKIKYDANLDYLANFTPTTLYAKAVVKVPGIGYCIARGNRFQVLDNQLTIIYTDYTTALGDCFFFKDLVFDTSGNHFIAVSEALYEDCTEEIIRGVFYEHDGEVHMGSTGLGSLGIDVSVQNFVKVNETNYTYFVNDYNIYKANAALEIIDSEYHGFEGESVYNFYDANKIHTIFNNVENYQIFTFDQSSLEIIDTTIIENTSGIEITAGIFTEGQYTLVGSQKSTHFDSHFNGSPNDSEAIEIKVALNDTFSIIENKLAIDEVEVSSFTQTDSLCRQAYTLTNFSASGVDVTLTNTGNTTITSFYLNAAHTDYCEGYCYLGKAIRKEYNIVDLEPGSSIQVEFRDIFFERLINSTEVCITVSNVNKSLSLDAPETKKCIYTVVTDTEEFRPDEVKLNTYLNFQSNTLEVKAVDVIKELLIFDLNGRMLNRKLLYAKAGSIPFSFPAGMYICKAIFRDQSFAVEKIIRP